MPASNVHPAVPKAGTTDTPPKYVLWLFVSGISPNSVRAIKNIETFCSEHLAGRYTLKIIDIYKQTALAITEQIIVVPVLIKKFPLPETRLIGDLSNKELVLEAFDLNRQT